MFVDASVIVAILASENDAQEFKDRLAACTNKLYVSPLVKFEATMGLVRAIYKPTKKNPKPSAELIEATRRGVDLFIQSLGAQEVAISGKVGDLAIKTAATYGKAIGHKADLNLGDCYAYSCAKSYRLKLLYKGNDFTYTDLA